VFKGDRSKQQAVLEALEAYIAGCPPGYRRALEVLKQRAFSERQHDFAEGNHRAALPHLPGKGAGIWGTFPHAFSGIARRPSRVNYIIRRSSPIARRLPLDLHYFTYGDVTRKLQALAQAKRVRPGKGSHEIWRTPLGKTVVVPRHGGDLSRGTVRSIIKQAGLDMSLDEFARA
jgi:predicted RNA binding protein YcfA (HicA-like mRNA interferase family)